MDARPSAAATPRERSRLRQVALPREHGGWGLTAEPVLLGLLVAPSWAGVAIGVAAFGAFLVRTPLAVVLVDRHRGRWLPRSRMAVAVAAGELATIGALAVIAVALAGWWWIVPVLVAAPLVGVELGFDARSRSRRLVPEVCGAVGMAATAASVALAGGADGRLAVALWAVLAARSVTAIPFVRTQIDRLHARPTTRRSSDAGLAAGVALAAGAAVVEPAVLTGAIAVALVALAQLAVSRQRPRTAPVLGIGETVAGLAVVVATAVGVAV